MIVQRSGGKEEACKFAPAYTTTKRKGNRDGQMVTAAITGPEKEADKEEEGDEESCMAW
ncbi:unnamed protein product [Protopolystoma xenopodis]|uniref:Uncharacterized protein n=1 Tax=Protopolystoma xenopodis TaxID=117903 RepID=A0A448WYW2_9PLAT|nr:unnamed protein product [Protopolystoma xenopodis]